MPKGRKQDSPFQGGLAGKVYFCAYMEPRSGYQLAKQVFGTREESKAPKNPGKIYSIVDKYHPDYFTKGEKTGNRGSYQIDANLDPLVSQVSEVFDIEEMPEKDRKKHRNSIKKYLDKNLRNWFQKGFRVTEDYQYIKMDLYNPENVPDKPLETILEAFIGIIDPILGAREALIDLDWENNSGIETKKAQRWMIEGFIDNNFPEVDKDIAMKWFEPLFDKFYLKKRKGTVLDLREKMKHFIYKEAGGEKDREKIAEKKEDLNKAYCNALKNDIKP